MRTVSCARGALLLVLGAGLLACGDDDGGQISTGLPKDQQLSSFDNADLMMACESVNAELADVITAEEAKRLECTTLAVPQSLTVSGGKQTADVAKCKQLVSRCMSGEMIAVGDDKDVAIDIDFSDNKDCSEQAAAREFQGCTATVAEYEDCLNAAVGAIDSFFALLDCDSLADLEKLQATVTRGLGIASLEQCKALEANCPNVSLGGGDEASDFEAAP